MRKKKGIIYVENTTVSLWGSQNDLLSECGLTSSLGEKRVWAGTIVLAAVTFHYTVTDTAAAESTG